VVLQGGVWGASEGCDSDLFRSSADGAGQCRRMVQGNASAWCRAIQGNTGNTGRRAMQAQQLLQLSRGGNHTSRIK